MICNLRRGCRETDFALALHILARQEWLLRQGLEIPVYTVLSGAESTKTDEFKAVQRLNSFVNTTTIAVGLRLHSVATCPGGARFTRLEGP